VSLEEGACNMGNIAFSKKNSVVLSGLELEILFEFDKKKRDFC
jgi:hypothetical protein